MSTEAAESDAGRGRRRDRRSGSPGDDDLPSVSCRADAGGDVNGQTDVPDFGQCRAAAVDPDTDADRKTVGEMAGPDAARELTLDRDGRFDGGGGPRENGAELISERVDLAAAPSPDTPPEAASDGVHESGAAVAPP